MKKRVILGLILALVLVLVISFATPAHASKPVSPEMVDAIGGKTLDYNGDGVADCWYRVIEFTYEGIDYVLVDYYDLRVLGNGKIRYTWDKLGVEYWNSKYGLCKDSFAPWTYPFPEQ